MGPIFRRVTDAEKDHRCGDDESSVVESDERKRTCDKPAAYLVRGRFYMQNTSNASLNGWYFCEDHGPEMARNVNAGPLQKPTPEAGE